MRTRLQRWVPSLSRPTSAARGAGSGVKRRAGALACAAAAAAIALTPFQADARGLIRDTEIERTLARMINPIFSAAGLGEDRVRLFIINNNSLNAFVSAGSAMFFHTGLLRQLETPEELIGVMAHETGHVTAGHFIQRVEAFRRAQTTGLLAQVVGIAAAAAGAGAAGVGAASGGQRIVQRDIARFTRSQESGADLEALRFMNKAGVDPSGMLRVLERLSQQQAIFLDNVDPYALSHPLGPRRIQTLQQGVAQSPALGKRVSDDMIYWHSRMRAKLDGFLSAPGAGGTSYGNPEIDLYREAIALHRAPRPDAAIAAVDRLIGMRPNDPFYWELKGQILFESGRGPQSVAPFEKALSLAPDAPLIAGWLGQALLTLESEDADKRALSVLERASLADKYDARLLRPLALAYARLGRDGMAAVVTAERLALSGRLRDAHRQAERAKLTLPVGSPGWLRAEDILAVKQR